MVDNIEETAAALDLVCKCPLSIIIVGIGDANFDGMRFLDDRETSIDICNFVQFNSHREYPGSLTKATLEEIPMQLTNYFVRHGIPPLPPIQVVVEATPIEDLTPLQLTQTIEEDLCGDEIDLR
jgi:hypothetical protein